MTLAAAWQTMNERSLSRKSKREWLGPFAERPFLAITFGGTLSAVGSSASTAALIWFVQTHTGSPAFLSLLLSVYWGARIVAQVFSGVVADRLNRAHAMILGDVAGGAIYLIIAAVVAAPWFRIDLLLPLYFVHGLLSQLYPVASQAALPDLVAKQQLVRANAALQACLDGGRILGPTVGTLLLSTAGPVMVFAANAVSFFVSAAATVIGRVSSRPLGEPSRTLESLRSGFRYVIQSRVVGTLAVVGLVLHIAIVPTETVFVSTLVKDVLKGSALMFGLTITTLNAGALVCGAVLSLVRMPFSPRDMLIIGIVVAGVSIMSMGAVRTTWGLWIAAFLYGAAGALLFAHVLTLVQQSTAPNMRGRAFSMMYVAVEVGSVTGLAVAAPTLALFGPRNVFWVMGTLTLITLLPVIVSMASMRSWRRSVSARQD